MMLKRMQYVITNANGIIKKSEAKLTTRGICQGQSKSYLYFSIYIKDLPLVLEYRDSFMFVDDTHTAIIGKPEKINELVGMLESDMTKLNNWIEMNKMNVYTDKCNFVIFGKATTTASLSDVGMS